jgi:hypothetical protein
MASIEPIATRPETGPIDEMTIDELRLLAHRLETENAAMRSVALCVAEARMCRDAVTMVESCPHCSLRRSATLGYSGAHDENCVVSQARRLGF